MPGLTERQPALMGRRKTVRMLKVIVTYCIVFTSLLYVVGIVLACTIVPAGDRADLLAKVLYYATWTYGGELLMSALVKLLGDKYDTADARKGLTKG